MLSGEERRQHILIALREGGLPVTGGELATINGVSRQVIVQDVALMRARGEEIVATPQGYLITKSPMVGPARAVLACRHGRDETEDELLTLVDLGIKVVDVIVEHPIYGELRAMLALESRDDVRNFISQIRESQAALLSALTKGVHLHTVEASRADLFQRAREALVAKGYLLTAEEP